MKRKTVLFLILIHAFSFVLVPVVNSVECVELKYDDGTFEVSGRQDAVGNQVGVKFSTPFPLGRLTVARFYIASTLVGFEIHVYDLDNNDLVLPFTVTPTSTGWLDVPLDVEVSGDFIIAAEALSGSGPHFGFDTDLIQKQTCNRESFSEVWTFSDKYDIGIRAVVCEISPIGGEILSNNVSTVGSWLIAGISIITLTAGIVLKKKKLCQS